MNTAQLEYILNVAKAGSINRVAQDFFLAHQSISQSIRALEEEIGYKIFIRSPVGVTLTEKGKTALKHFQNMWDAYQNILKIGELLTDDLNGELRIITAPVFQLLLSPSFTASFLNSYENISLSLKIEENRDIQQQLLKQDADGYFLLYNESEEHNFIASLSKDVQHISLFSDELLILLSKAHPLAKHQTINLKMLYDYPLSIFQPASYEDNLIIPFFPKKPKIKYSTDNLSSLLTFIEQSNSYVFLLASCAVANPLLRDSAELKLMRLTKPIYMSCSLLVPHSLSKNQLLLLKAFTYFLFEHLNKMPPENLFNLPHPHAKETNL